MTYPEVKDSARIILNRWLALENVEDHDMSKKMPWCAQLLQIQMESRRALQKCRSKDRQRAWGQIKGQLLYKHIQTISTHFALRLRPTFLWKLRMYCRSEADENGTILQIDAQWATKNCSKWSILDSVSETLPSYESSKTFARRYWT